MGEVIALVPAAGSGTRFAAAAGKLWIPMAGRPVLVWTLARLRELELREIVVALPAQQLERQRAHLAAHGLEVHCVAGGTSRQESVAQALAASAAGPDDLVLVHDGARPAVAVEDLRRTLWAAEEADGAVLGRRLEDTLKRLEGDRIVGTEPREARFRAETPQVFRRALLERALVAAAQRGFQGTDEASLVEALGGKHILAVEAAFPNPKLTRPADGALLARLLAAGSVPTTAERGRQQQ